MKFASKLKMVVFSVLCCVFTFCMGTFFVGLGDYANAFTSTANSGTVLNLGNILVNNYATKDRKFDGDQLDKLYEKLTGTKGATLNSLAATFSKSAVNKFGSQVVQNPTINANKYNGKSNQDVIITFGGIEWTITSLTKDKVNGHYVATLLQATPSAAAMMSPWSDSNDSTYFKYTYPAVIYSTTKLRNEVLNANGCGWAEKSSSTTLVGANTQNANNKYAIFTMPSVSGSLTDFILTPAKIAYQETENYNAEVKNGYTWPNEAYGTPVGTLNGAHINNIKGKSHQGDWKDDYVWLPSYTEINGSNSIWQSSAAQREENTHNWLRSSFRGFFMTKAASGIYGYTANSNVGYRPCLHLDLTAAENNSIRKVTAPTNVSVEYNGEEQAINTTNAPWYNSAVMDLKYDDDLNVHTDKCKIGVTISLTNENYYFEGMDVATRSTRVIFEISGIKCPASDIYLSYDGEEHKDSTIKSQTWWNDDYLTVDYVDSGNYTDAGEYVVSLTLSDDNISFPGYDESLRTIEIKIVIEKVGLTMQPFTIDDQTGLPTSPLMPTLAAYPDRDTELGIEPEFALEYKKVSAASWTTTPPTVAGDYVARVYIVNAEECNYVLDNNIEIPFEKAKQNVTLAFFVDENGEAGVQDTDGVGTTLVVEYTGVQQSFKLVNTLDHTALNDATILACGGGLRYDKATGIFTAKSVGTYTVTISLADGGANTRWANYAQDLSITRVINLVIEKAKLNVVVENDTLTSWSNGTRDNIIVNITGVVNDEPVKVNVFYTSTPNGGTTSAPIQVAESNMVNSDGKITVTIDLATFRAETSYNLYAELDSSSTINNNYQLISPGKIFDFFILTATISKIDVEWILNNVAYSSQVVTDGVSVDYNRLEYTMDVNELLLPSGVSYTYKTKTGTFSTEYEEGLHSGTDAFDYETVVKFTANPGYEFVQGLQTEYVITWKINPKQVELSTIPWPESYTWTGMNIRLWLDDPDYYMISITQQNDETYTGIAVDVGDYNAKLDLRLSDTNHIFTLDPANSFGIQLSPDGTSATVYREWHIEKVVVSVSNATNKWESVKDFDDNFNEYSYLVPIVDQNNNAVLVEYFTDRDFTNKVPDIKAINVTPGTIETYYARVTVDPDHRATHKIVNSVNGQDYAWIAFTVGDTRLPITVTLNYDDTGVTYTGSPISVIAKYGDIPFDITYFKLDENGEYIPMNEGEQPTNVGVYQVHIEPTNQEHKDGYNIINKVFYLYINPIKANVLSWKIEQTENSDGLEIPEVLLYSDSEIPSDSYVYVIYDENGNEVSTEAIEHNRQYTISVKVADGVDYLVFDENDIEAGLTSYSFRTGFGEGEEYETLTIPTLDKTQVTWNGEEQTFVIVGWDSIKDYVDIISGNLSQTEVGNYSVILRLKSGVSAVWEGNSLDDVVLNFEIIKLTIQKPTATEIRYTGNAIDIFDYLTPEGNWRLWFDVVEGSSDSIQTNVGVYVLRLKLKEQFINNIIWDETTTFMLSREAGDDIIEINWEIKPAQIKGEWKNDKGYLEFVPEDQNFNQLFKVVYFDAEGNEVLPENFIPGVKYTAKLMVIDQTIAGNYEFVSDVENFEIEQEFEFEKPKTFFENALEYVKTNWRWFAIGGGALLLLIILIIIVASRKKRKKKKAKQKEAEEAKKAEEKLKTENSDKAKLELEKAELEKKLAEAKYQQNNFNQMPQNYGQVPLNAYNQMPTNNYNQVPSQTNQPYNPNYQAPVNAAGEGYRSQYDIEQDERLRRLEKRVTRIYDVDGNEIIDPEDELELLRAKVRKLEKFKLATEEEKSQNKQLANTEAMLMNFLLDKFKNKPDWLPFDNQDMVNYPLDKLMEIYSQAKDLIENKLSNQPKEIRKVESQAKGFENKVDKYTVMKDDYQYERILEEIRGLKQENKELADKLEKSEKRQSEKELEETKAKLLKSEAELEKVKAENKQHEHDKLFDELSKKNEPQPVTPVINKKVSVKPEFEEAFSNLPQSQKKYFNTLKDYALSKPKARIKNTKYNLSVGVGNTNYIKFAVKYDNLVASFGTTEVKIENENSVEDAKKLIDECVANYLNSK